MVTSKDVAKIANVSASTVSRVFSNPALVNKETSEKVLNVAKQLHYVPNVAARNLKLNKSGIFGVVLSDLNNTFYTYILREMFPEIQKKEYRLFMVFSEEDAAIELDSIEKLVASSAEIIVFTPVQQRVKAIENTFLRNRIASLQLYRCAYDKIDSLTIDDAYGTYLATKELIEHGHRNIALIDYDLEIPTNRDFGYIRAYEEMGLSYNPRNILRLSPVADYASAIATTLSEIKPSAIIPVSSVFASATISYLKHAGLRIKDDVSIIVYDDVTYAEFLDLSVISHPLQEIAETAANMVFERIGHFDGEPVHRQIKPFLLRRNSVRRIG